MAVIEIVQIPSEIDIFLFGCVDGGRRHAGNIL